MRRCEHGVDLDMWSCETHGCSSHSGAEEVVAGPMPVPSADSWPASSPGTLDTFALAWTDVIGLLLLAAIMFGAGFVVGKYAP